MESGKSNEYETFSQQIDLINKEYEILELNLKNLEYKKHEQSERENNLVMMTKQLRVKANELNNKEKHLRQR